MEGPRERLAAVGPSRLSEAELLALLLGTGRRGEDVMLAATKVLRSARGLWGLRRMSATEMRALPGVGPVKAARLVAAFEVGLRALSEPVGLREPLTDSRRVFERFGARLMGSRVERFVVVPVDAKNRPLAEHEVARGGRTACQVDPAEVFRLLVVDGASGAVLLHNHPSGDPEPSAQDLDLTARLVAAGHLLEIRMLDHLVVGRGRYTSLRDAGLWPANPPKSGASMT